MRRILPGLAMTALFLGLLPSAAVAQADHLQCFMMDMRNACSQPGRLCQIKWPVLGGHVKQAQL